MLSTLAVEESSAALESEGFFLILILVVMLFPLVMERFRIPGLLGLILGGFLVGPNGLALVPAEPIAALGDLGLLYLMFLAGAELDLIRFAARRGQALAFGLVTFAAPFALGLVVISRFEYSGWALVLIASFWASHTLVTLPVVKAFGLSRNAAVSIAVAATLITDTLALSLLGVVSAAVGSDGAAWVVLVEVAAALFVLVGYCMWLLPRIGRWWFAGPGRAGASRYLFVLVALLSAGALANELGLEGIVGAFFAGLGINRLLPEGSPLMERTEFFGQTFFIPFFLLSIGLVVDPSVMFEPRTLLLGVVFSAVVIVGKSLAAVLVRRRAGFTWDEVGLTSGMTIPQAAATLAAASVGLELGLYGADTFNAVIVTVAATLVVSAVLTRAFARRVPVPEQDVASLGERVVVALGSREETPNLIAAAARVASADGGLLLPVHVNIDSAAQVGEDASAILRASETELEAAGAEGRPRIRLAPTIARGVRNTVLESGGTSVVLGWSAGPGLLFKGPGRAEEIIAASPVPSLVFVRAPGDPMERVVFALDFAHAQRPMAAALLQQLSARAKANRLAVLVLHGDQEIGELTEPAGDDDSRKVRRTADPLAEAARLLTPSDVLVVPAEMERSVVSSRALAIAQERDAGLLVVAPPGLANRPASSGSASGVIVN